MRMFRVCLDIKSNFNEIVKGFDLTFSQWQVLKVINMSANKKMLLIDIVDELNSDKATISIIVKKLIDKGMVYKVADISDKRKKYIKLTDEMLRKCSQLKKIEYQFEKDIFKNITEEEQEIFESILNKM